MLIEVRSQDFPAPAAPAVQVPVIDGVGRGLAAIGQGLDQLAEAKHRNDLQNDQLAIADAWGKYRTGLHEDFAAAERDAPADGAGLGQKLRDSAAQRRQAALDSLPSDRARKMISPHLDGDMAEMGIKADASELKLRQAHVTRRVGEVADTMGGLVRVDPGKTDHALAVLEEAINQTDLPQADKEGLKARYRNEVPTYAILGQVDKDPYAALRELESGAWTGKASPAAIHKGIEAAQTEIRRLEAKRESDLHKRRPEIAAEIDNQIRLGYDDPSARRPLPADYDAVLTPLQAEEGRLRIHYAQQLGGLMRDAKYADPNTLIEAINALKPKPEDPNYAIRSKAFEDAQQLAARSLQERHRDPGAWLEGDAHVAEAWNRGDYETAIGSARQLGRNAGLLDSAPVISPNRAAAIAAQINNAPAEQTGFLLDDIARRAGKHWGELQNALITTGKLDKNLLALTLVDNPTLRADLAVAAQIERINGDGSMRRSASDSRGDDAIKEGEKELLGYDSPIGQFTSALRNMGGRNVDQRILAIEHAARLRFYDLMKKDASGDKGDPRLIAKIVSKEIIDGQYYLSDKNRMMIIPKFGPDGRPWDAEKIEKRIVERIHPDELSKAGASGEAPLDYADSIIRREDADGHKTRILKIKTPPPGDGATAEIAGLTKEHHPDAFTRIAALPETQRYEAVKTYIRDYTASVTRYATDQATKGLLADATWHRGPAGSADMARLTLGQKMTGKGWDEKLAKDFMDLPIEFRMKEFTNARYMYEVEKNKLNSSSEREKFAQGFRNRWNDALKEATITKSNQIIIEPDKSQIKVMTTPDMAGVVVGRFDRSGHFIPFKKNGENYTLKFDDMSKSSEINRFPDYLPL